MLYKTESDLTADEYVTRYIPGFTSIPPDYKQCLIELREEASTIAARYGLENEKETYPAWIWDRVFGD